jgi:hypothetical protein
MFLIARRARILMALTIIAAPAMVRTDDQTFAARIPVQANNATAITDVTVIDVSRGFTRLSSPGSYEASLSSDN